MSSCSDQNIANIWCQRLYLDELQQGSLELGNSFDVKMSHCESGYVTYSHVSFGSYTLSGTQNMYSKE